MGSFVAGTIALLAYRLTISIATTFANKPIVSDNTAVINHSPRQCGRWWWELSPWAQESLGWLPLGLFLLGIQLTFQRILKSPASDAE